MASLIWWVPILPLIGVIINSLFLTWASPQTKRRYSGWLAVAMVVGSFLIACTIAANLHNILAGAEYKDVEWYKWIEIGDLSLPMALRIDPLSVTMMLVVTGVGSLIHIFSVGYMADDERFGRFFTYLNLFTFSMLMLVLANNYVLLFVGWEGVGLCSYLLIGFWYEKWSAAQAGKKAFLVNRIGDFGFLLGLFALFWMTNPHTLVFNTPEGTGALDAAQASALYNAQIWGVPAVTVICLLLFVGATGKSAQLPLYLWLPDAMEGPTPVSALIHAATMVTAGVYLVARSAALYGQSHLAQTVISWVGILTALWAAVIAIKQYDIKRVLAYSTISQLGYMFVGVGVGAYAAGISHLITHAFFKALMFLGAGAVMHALEGQLDMRKMGNMRRHMPITFLTFAVGWYAICGLPPLSGFFSKDFILENAHHHNPIIYWIGVFVAGLTAFYMTRMFVTVFFGPERIEMGDEGHGKDAHGHAAHGHAAHPEPAKPQAQVRPATGRKRAGQARAAQAHSHEADHGHAHDAGHGHSHDAGHGHGHGHGHHGVHVHPEQAVMNWPLIVLAVLAFFGGAVVMFLPQFIHGVTAGMVPLHEAAHGAAHGAAEVAHGAAEAAHGAAEAAGGLKVGHPMEPWSLTKTFTDPLTYVSIGAGLLGVLGAWFGFGPEKFARGWSPAGERLLDAHARIYEGLAHSVVVRGGWAFSQALYQFIDRGIDWVVNATGTFTNYLAESLRTLQTGYVRNYALVMLAGAVFVVACFMVILQQTSK